MSTVGDNSEILVLKQQQLMLSRQKLAAVRANGLKYYKPWGKQNEFHRAGKYRRRMIRAGNRTGKSTLGCAEDIAWLLGHRPWYPEGDDGRYIGIPKHKTKGLVITTTWKKVDEVFTSQRGGDDGKLWKYMPQNFVKKVKRNHDGVVAIVECENGSLLRFDTVQSFQNDPQATESSDWDFIHVDEPCPEPMWKAASRGLMDRHGSAWFTLTPLSEFWINDMFFPADTSAQGAVRREDVWAIHASTYENPYLTKESISAFEADLSPEERECRLNGLPLHLSGLIYKQFSWAKHVLKELPKGWSTWTQPPADWPVYFYVDYHPRTPHCVLFVTVAPNGQRIYFRDIYFHCSTENLAKMILEATKGLYVIRGRIDPFASINDPITESNGIEELARHGVYVEKATKALGQGILRVQGNLGKENEIYFTPACERSLWEIQRYAWDEDEDKPIDKDDHAMECLYRAELDDPRWMSRAYVNPEPIKPLEITSPPITFEDINVDYAV